MEQSIPVLDGHIKCIGISNHTDVQTIRSSQSGHHILWCWYLNGLLHLSLWCSHTAKKCIGLFCFLKKEKIKCNFTSSITSQKIYTADEHGPFRPNGALFGKHTELQLTEFIHLYWLFKCFTHGMMHLHLKVGTTMCYILYSSVDTHTHTSPMWRDLKETCFSFLVFSLERSNVQRV